MQQLTALDFSQQVQHYANEHNETLLSSTVVICDRHGVPYEEVTKFQVGDANVNLITPQLKDKLAAECDRVGLLKGRKYNTHSLMEYI